jgi:hypothetical protein
LQNAPKPPVIWHDPDQTMSVIRRNGSTPFAPLIAISLRFHDAATFVRRVGKATG